MNRTLLAMSLVLLLQAPMPVPAQSSASLSGTVLDPTGAGVPGAKITLADSSRTISRSIVSDRLGTYQFVQLAPGSYSLRVEKEGFKTLTREDLRLNVAVTTTLNPRLEVGAVSEQVTVTAATPLLNSVDATRGNVISEEEIKRLPFLARNPVNLLTLQAGVVFTGATDTDALYQGSATVELREGVVSGVRGNQGNITVDGVDANDWQTQAAFTSALPVTLDSIQEFRVTTSNGNPTDGISAGAQLALITRSGSNDFHGNLRWFRRDTEFSANSFFNNRSGVARPKLNRNIGGASLGGRLLRDRLFFFGDFEGRRDNSETTQSRTVPTESLKQGQLRYRTTTGAIATLDAAGFLAIDPARRGVNPAMLNYLKLYPAGDGSGDGLITTGYRFNTPIETDNNLYTFRMDYNISRDGRHVAFWRGNLGDIRADLQGSQFPGQPPASRLLNNSKGFATGYTAQLRPNLINTLRWGLTRQGIDVTGNPAPRFHVTTATSSLSDLSPTARAARRIVPVHLISDDVNWIRNRHTVQAGGMLRFVRNDRSSYANSFSDYNVFQTSCANLCRDMYTALVNSGVNVPSDPNAFGDGVMLLTGAITQVTAKYQVDLQSQRLLPDGSPQARRFNENGFELYAQDSWRIRPNLTVTYGLRYTYFTPLSEANGEIVRPDIDVQDWWNLRQSDMSAGRPSDASPILKYVRAPDNRWYSPDRNNFAPRIALAWTTLPKTSIRAGYGIYYDRLGGALATTNDQYGSPGLATSVVNPTGQLGLANAPRFSGSCGAAGCTGLPDLGLFVTPPSSATLPFVLPSNGSFGGFLIDNRLKNPYAQKLTLSAQRELPGGFLVDAAYVGTLGRKLLIMQDYAQFYGNLKDTASGQTFWQAQNQIADLIGPTPARPAIDPRNPAAVAVIRPIPFIENLLSNMPAFSGNPGLTPTQAFYVFSAAQAPNWARTVPLFDVGLRPGNSPWARSIDPQQDGYVLSPPQFRNLPGWNNYGSSNYHAFQLSVRRNVGIALIGLNYAYSKSIDNASTAENGPGPSGQATGQISNAFSTGADRGISDFDLRHNFNAHWVVDLPFGKGRRYANHLPSIINGAVGGWQLSGVARYHSGLPYQAANGASRATNVQLSGNSTISGSYERDITKSDPNGFVNFFSNPAQTQLSVTPSRPGSAGSRNPLHGPPYQVVDLGVNKRFKLPGNDRRIVEFRATAFNALNHANFYADYFSNNMGGFASALTFGRLTATAGPRGGAREMEMALRLEF